MAHKRDDSLISNGGDHLNSAGAFYSNRVHKQLGLQRCHSDGILVNGNINNVLESMVGKSSSDSNMNFTSDINENKHLDTMDGVTNGIPRPQVYANDLSPVGETTESITVNEKPSDFHGISSNASCDIVRPKTWSRRVVQKKKEKMKNSKRKIKPSDIDHVNIEMDGLDIVNGYDNERRGYSRTVCDAYRQETDLIFGRTRGGTMRNNDANTREELQTYKHKTDNSDARPFNLIEPTFINGAGLHGNRHDTIHTNHDSGHTTNIDREDVSLVAPLALPENFSDEETLSSIESLKNIKNPLSEESVVSCKTKELMPNTNHDVEEIEHFENGSHTDARRRFEPYNNFSVASNPSQNDQHVRDINGAHFIDQETVLHPSNTHRHHDPRDFIGNRDMNVSVGLDDDVDEGVDNHHIHVRPSRSSSLESIEDFIEADLPPNIDRLAFFSRGSTTDEDEGCGDEVLPNNDDEESENETIDPLANGHRSPGPFMHNTENSQALGNNFRHQPNFLQNPLIVDSDYDDNDDVEYSNECFSDVENTNRIKDSSTENGPDNIVNGDMKYSSSNKDRVSKSSSIKEDNICVCCDRQVDVKYQRTEEIGVIVCDKCFNELDFVGNRKFDKVVRKKSRTLCLGAISDCSNNKQLLKNNNFLMIGRNPQEKVSNKYLRLSSSDSEPIDRLYVSDSSEMVSPDVDTGTESVFQSSSATSSDTTFVQYLKIGENEAGRDGRTVDDVPTLRQAASLDYNSPEETLYCPFFYRRSRSLDYEFGEEAAFNRSSDCDMPNIAVTNSNFQDDESNTHEKVFEKHAYDVDATIPTCSSSDEEENMRVPHDTSNENEGLTLSHESDDLSMIMPRSRSAEVRGQHNDLNEEEPIYEDIDDLELLLMTASSDGEPDPQTQPLCNAISKLRRKRRHRSPISDVEKVMIWNEYEAYVVQVKQIGTSACGPTAVLNVLKAFDFQVEKEEVSSTITSNLRMEAAPIPYYLFSRCTAGTTADTLLQGVSKVTRGAIKGRFFHFYPQRDVELLKWLGHWIKKGAVPMATLNLQRGVKPGWTIPDAWHHQMVYGVSSKGVYLTNPLEIVPESVILDQLTSDSVLLVRRQDVVTRFRDWCPLNEILKQQDTRWCTMNVLGQIVHMLREQCMPQDQLPGMKSQLTSHIQIPAAYKAGIILFVRANTDLYQELLDAPDLPLKHTQN